MAQGAPADPWTPRTAPDPIQTFPALGSSKPPRSHRKGACWKLETELLAGRAQKGDQAAFEALYVKTSGRVYAVCLRMSGSSQEAEELTQDVYVRCWERLHQFRGDSLFTTWLHRLAVNLIVEQRKKRTRVAKKEMAVEDLDAYGRHVEAVMPETRIDLERAIAGLPPRAREALILRDVEGYTYKEVARMTGVAVGTVKAQVHRARKLVRRALNL